MASAKLAGAGAEVSRRAFLRRASKVAVVLGASAAAEISVPRAANAARTFPDELPSPYVVPETGEVKITQPTISGTLPPAVKQKIVEVISSEIAATMGLKRNAPLEEVGDKIGDKNYSGGRFYDPVASDTLGYFYDTGKYHMGFIASNKLIEAAFLRALETLDKNPDMRAHVAGMSVSAWTISRRPKLGPVAAAQPR